MLRGHDLRFHKSGRDGSGKCDAYATGEPQDFVLGALFEISAHHKPGLDKAEGLGYGYEEKCVILVDESGVELEATTYYATDINEQLKPYSWYKHHVLVGAQESSLPASYISRIVTVDSIEDPDRKRDARQRAIHP